MRAWGENATGELGNGRESDRPTPVRANGLRNVAALAAGGSFSLALREGTAEGEEFVAITKGDWVVVSAEGCDEARRLPPSSAGDNFEAAVCPPDGAVLMVVGGPDESEAGRYWALSGFGWFSEEHLRFDYEGQPALPGAGRACQPGADCRSWGRTQGLWLMNADGTDRHRINRGPVARAAAVVAGRAADRIRRRGPAADCGPARGDAGGPARATEVPLEGLRLGDNTPAGAAARCRDSLSRWSLWTWRGTCCS